MKLIYNISLRLSLVLFPLIALWAVVFYFTMMDEINDEADDALEDYSELIGACRGAFAPFERRFQ